MAAQEHTHFHAASTSSKNCAPKKYGACFQEQLLTNIGDASLSPKMWRVTFSMCVIGFPSLM